MADPMKYPCCRGYTQHDPDCPSSQPDARDAREAQSTEYDRMKAQYDAIKQKHEDKLTAPFRADRDRLAAEVERLKADMSKFQCANAGIIVENAFRRTDMRKQLATARAALEDIASTRDGRGTRWTAAKLAREALAALDASGTATPLPPQVSPGEALPRLADLEGIGRDLAGVPDMPEDAEHAALVRVAEAAEQWDHEWSIAPFTNTEDGESVCIRSHKWREMLHGGREAVNDALADLRRARNEGSDD